MNLEAQINAAWQARAELTPAQLKNQYGDEIPAVLDGLETGALRVSEPIGDAWQVNQWLKKAVLLYFTVADNQVMTGTTHNYWDKVPCRFKGATAAEFQKLGARVYLRKPYTLEKLGEAVRNELNA